MIAALKTKKKEDKTPEVKIDEPAAKRPSPLTIGGPKEEYKL